MAVVMAGAPFGLRLLHLDTMLRWPSIAEFNESWIPEAAKFCFLFCTLPKGGDASRIQLLMESRTRRIIPVVVGESLCADWRLTALRPAGEA